MKQIKNSGTIIKKSLKKSKIIFSKFFVSSYFATLLFAITLRVYLFFYLMAVVEGRRNAEMPLLQKMLSHDTGDELTLLANIIEIGSFILMIVSVLYLLFSLVIFLRREFLLAEKTLAIKTQLGTHPAIVTLEFIGEFVIVNLLAILAGMISVYCLYAMVCNLDSWISAYLISPWKVLVNYDLIYVFVGVLLLAILSVSSYQKMKRTFYRKNRK
ncbi:hypothetical protein M2139_002693 [Enterococcus sp. PF1-24]|uniref:hypothetical protein n=1 Tax=unclassified Enterococcus TaxID=2608891 RepID=UPI0024755128|nr:MULTISPECIES: hypothetical protein [unclassified Enterococcus]MDH6365687.1 hypothetical protein [Enterococcus sp. PFB1-1]MDH6402787.1 hypothetical protein [Enterococcus sp. PF1-24]